MTCGSRLGTTTFPGDVRSKATVKRWSVVVALLLRHHGHGAERGQSSRCWLGVGGGGRLGRVSGKAWTGSASRPGAGHVEVSGTGRWEGRAHGDAVARATAGAALAGAAGQRATEVEQHGQRGPRRARAHGGWQWERLRCGVAGPARNHADSSALEMHLGGGRDAGARGTGEPWGRWAALQARARDAGRKKEGRRCGHMEEAAVQSGPWGSRPLVRGRASTGGREARRGGA